MSLRLPRGAANSAASVPRGSAGVFPARYGNGFSTVRPAVLATARLLMTLPLTSAAPLFASRGLDILGKDEDAPKSPEDPNLWAYLGIAVALVLLGGAFAGLTIALMGQDETYLQVIATSGEGAEKNHATKVLNLLKKGKHWVLVTLLLSNVITNETLPIVLDRSLGGGWPAVVSSTVLIVIFGEIVPQSVCVRYGLSIGAFMAPPVLGLMWLMFPIAWPTAKLLDWLLGADHGTMYKKAGLKTLVQLHKTLGTAPNERLMEDEVTIINSVLDLKDKPVGSIMTPMGDVFTMTADTVLNEPMMDTILSQGYSRIPICAPENPRNFIGMLLVKILITYDPEDCMRVRDFALATLPETAPETSCLDIINFFQEGKSHMVLVSDFPGQDRGAIGVVTLEDVIEELIGEEIIDESDVFVDVHKAIRRMAPAPRTRYHKNAAHAEPPIDDDDDREAGEDKPLLEKQESAGSRRVSFTSGQPVSMTMRRPSSSSEDPRTKPRPVQVRSNTVDLKQHLKHLGPSNAASNPRSTKFKSITVKPGVGTIPENAQTTKGINGKGRSASLDISNSGPDGGEGTGLLKSAGKDASDAVQAVQAGYGTIDSPNSQRRGSYRDNVPEIVAEGGRSTDMSASDASRMARENATPPATADGNRGRNGGSGSPKGTLQVPNKMIVGNDGSEQEGDRVGEMEGPASRDRSKSRRTARSGSITETTVDVGGMKKTVLEPGSSSASDGDEAKSRKLAPGEQSSAENSEATKDADGNGDAARKRKKKSKKKKGKGNGED